MVYAYGGSVLPLSGFGIIKTDNRLPGKHVRVAVPAESGGPAIGGLMGDDHHVWPHLIMRKGY